MTRIVTTTYRYKRPPKKRKAVELDVPAIVTKRTAEPVKVTPAPPWLTAASPPVRTSAAGVLLRHRRPAGHRHLAE